MGNRSGYWVNNLSGDAEYKSFSPAPLPPVPPIRLDERDICLLGEANRRLSHLNTLVTSIPDMNLFISMYVRKEALVSSQIEGTQCTLDDVFAGELEKNANQDVTEVINYIRATEYAVKRMETLPLCNRFIRELHRILMKGTRGEEKDPGEFRRSQNWIGGTGCTLKNARYVPPNPEDMKAAISDLEKFMNEDDSLDPLIQAALIHYQFETIHPFLDGNGRVGRMMIPLFLMDKKVLSAPILHLSCYLKINRVEYYDRISEVRRKGDYEQWIRFFLNAISETSSESIETIGELRTLHQSDINRIRSLYPKQNDPILTLFMYLEKNPIIETGKTAEKLNISYNTAAKLIQKLVDMDILTLSGKSGRTKLFSYYRYLEILRKDTELN